MKWFVLMKRELAASLMMADVKEMNEHSRDVDPEAIEDEPERKRFRFIDHESEEASEDDKELKVFSSFGREDEGNEKVVFVC